MVASTTSHATSANASKLHPPNNDLQPSFHAGVVYIAGHRVTNPLDVEFRATIYTMCLSCPLSGRLWITHKRYSSLRRHRHVLLKLSDQCLPHTKSLFEALLWPFPRRRFVAFTTAAAAERIAGLTRFVNALVQIRSVCAGLLDARGHPKAVMEALMDEVDTALGVPFHKHKPRTTVGKWADEEASKCCSICLEEMVTPSSKSIRLRCGHVFHCACIGPWVINQMCCPLCRADV
ncbi:Aste57867_24344 [Aphanomyces stellatus]|uniref:Aste57867_24344 protein n=1 Tax=Aphanomyces stellatus TaxID=120398 RepID=A0A485LRS3_9STRA|nr:hypothetical protein As57867_024268 [Aphanomyces stellatus]VFU00984.1 Aste57867_24344 [Aphanomyces stellatus]